MVSLRQIDVSGYLLERSEPFGLVEGQVFDGPEETGGSSGDVDDGEGGVLEVSFLQEGHFRLLRNGLSLDLMLFHRCH